MLTATPENGFDVSRSAYERGVQYVRALDAGLYASPRKLAEATGITLTDVKACLVLARLPEDAVAAFPRVTSIRVAWSKKLEEAQERDPRGFLERAKALRHRGGTPTATAVYAELMRVYEL